MVRDKRKRQTKIRKEEQDIETEECLLTKQQEKLKSQDGGQQRKLQ